MRGSKCRCGFSTVSIRRACPKCGRAMEETEWPDSARVLSFTKLQALPEGLKETHNLALVTLKDGPKLVCWTRASSLKEDEEVTVADIEGKYYCSPVDLSFKVESKGSKLD